MIDVVVILGSDMHHADRSAMSLAVRRLSPHPTAWCSDQASMRYAMAVTRDARWLVDERAGAAPLFDVAVAGTIDELTLGQLAAARDATLMLDVLDIEPTRDGLRVVRDRRRGATDVCLVAGPVVLAVSDLAVNDLYVSRYRRATASGVPPPRHGGQRESDGGWQPVRRRTSTAGIAEKTSGSATRRAMATFGITGEQRVSAGNHIIAADAATCAEHLLRFLVHHEWIEAPPVTKIEPDRAADEPRCPSERRPVRGATVAGKLARGPRPLRGAPPGVSRRPRPVGARPGARRAAQYARRPRPVGQAAPSAVRGPYPMES